MGLWTGLTGAMAVRSQFMWMFGFFEVNRWFSMHIVVHYSIFSTQLFMRACSRLQGTSYEVRFRNLYASVQ